MGAFFVCKATPVGGYGTPEPTDITGLAGKYCQGYGNYFDPVGDVIYDPYPTSGCAGFELDAVGVINQSPVPIPGTVWLQVCSG